MPFVALFVLVTYTISQAYLIPVVKGHIRCAYNSRRYLSILKCFFYTDAKDCCTV